MAHNVKCYYCGRTFDRDIVPFIKIEGTRRYAHKNCNLDNIKEVNKDKILLDNYIKKLFRMDFVPPRVVTQIKEYNEQMKMSFHGIHMTLFYCFDIKCVMKPDLINPTIALVPYYYKEASEYFKKISQAVELNKDKKVDNYIPKVQTVKIKSPQKNPMRKRQLFTFLDEEVEDDV